MISLAQILFQANTAPFVAYNTVSIFIRHRFIMRICLSDCRRLGRLAAGRC
jgi:hypothetical protein